MNRGILAVLGAGLVLGGAGLVGTLTGDESVTVESVAKVKPADTLRVVRLPACPSEVSQDAPVCEQTVTLGTGECLCWTDQAVGTVDGEATTPRRKLIVCPGKNPAKDPPRTSWYERATPVPANCAVAAEPVIDQTVGSMETDLVVQLRAACAPCPVSGTSWGPCPRCLLTDGGCAAACPAK